MITATPHDARMRHLDCRKSSACTRDLAKTGVQHDVAAEPPFTTTEAW